MHLIEIHANNRQKTEWYYTTWPITILWHARLSHYDTGKYIQNNYFHASTLLVKLKFLFDAEQCKGITAKFALHKQFERSQLSSSWSASSKWIKGLSIFIPLFASYTWRETSLEVTENLPESLINSLTGST